MAMLAVLGPVVARRAGPWRMLALYLAVMPLAALACAWVAGPEGSTAGASGAIHGLAGAVMLFAARDGHAGRAAGWVLAVALANAWFWWLTDGAFAWQVHLAGIGIGVGRAAVIRPPETKNAAPGGGVRSDTRQGWLRTPDPRICS
jgi:membrane associated rhomboid family serine protease